MHIPNRLFFIQSLVPKMQQFAPKYYERIFATDINNHDAIELVGTVLYIRDKYIKFLDFTKVVEIYKDRELLLEKDRYALQCKVYANNVLYCVKARKISFYEEIYYWIEISEKMKRKKESALHE